MITTVLLYVAIPLFAYLIVKDIVFARKHDPKLPPFASLSGPKILPEFIRALMIMFNDFHLQSRVEHAKEYGDAYGSPGFISRNMAVSLHGPNAMKWVYKADRLYMESDFPLHWKRLLGRRSISNTQGDIHKRLRNVLGTAFTSESLASYLHFAQMTTLRFLDELVELSKNGYIKVHPRVKEFAMNIALRIILSQDMLSDDRLKDMLTDYSDWVGGLGTIFPIDFPGTGYRRALNAREKINSVVRLFVEERRANEQKYSGFKDVLQNLMRAKDENGDHLDDETIVDTVLTFIFAGHDTSTASICSCFYALDKDVDPEFLKSLVDEVCEAFPDSKEDFSFEKMNSLVLLEAFVKELLRMYSPIPGMTRTVVEPVGYREFQFDKGQSLILQYGAMMKDGQYFQDPLKFDPRRFLAGREEDKQNSYAYLPFGGGTRLCLGRNLARMEIKCFLVYLLRGYRVEVGEFKNISFPILMVSPEVKLFKK